MPRTCSICAHGRRAEIERALVTGTPYRKITERFSVSSGALSRHKNGHLPEKLAKAEEAEEVAEAGDLLSQMEDLQRRTLRLLEEAESAGEKRTALQAVGHARRNLELLAEMQGELARQGTVNVEIDQLQAVVLGALDGRPDARAAVARALYEIDGNETE